MTDEEWAPIPGFEGLYEASSAGRIRSTRRRGTGGGVLYPSEDRYGHQRVHLWRNNQSHARTVHSVIIETFVGPRPAGLHVRHLDGNARNNALHNIVYDTIAENNRDLVRHGVHHLARRTHCKNGHEFTPENTHFPAKGGRACRACGRIRNARYAPKRIATRLIADARKAA